MAAMISQSDLVIDLLVFLMATFLGIELIRHVSRLLHTPLMALTNAISSVSIVAGLIVLSETSNETILLLVAAALSLASTNIVSGFLITERILKMFGGRTGRKKSTKVEESNRRLEGDTATK